MGWKREARGNKDFEISRHLSRSLLVLRFRIITSASPTINTVTATVTIGSKPAGVAITPNSEYAYVTNAGGTTVSVISTDSNASPSPKVPEFSTQLTGITLVVFMIIIISVTIIAKNKNVRKI